VISFPLSSPDDPILAGELVVSAELAVLMAAEDGVEPRDELALYIVHGLLHLCGYDDSNESDAAEMRRREAEILAESGYSNPWAVGSDRIHQQGEPPPESRATDSAETRIDRPVPVCSSDSPLPTPHSPLLRDRGACP
jgi:hypothetical protein